nr:hypothetical protein [Tanacetum cinerariifolium]
MRPFGCPITILNTTDHLGKFDGKADEGFFVGYSLNSKSFRVFNSRTKIVEENLHIRFSKNTSNVVGSGPDWLFNIDALTRTMNYEPIVASIQSNDYACTKASDNAGQARMKIEPVKDYILLPLWTADTPFSQDPKNSHDDGSKPLSNDGKKVDEDPRKENECNDQEKEDNVNINNNVNIVSSIINTASTNEDNKLSFDLNMPSLEYVSIFNFSNDEDDDIVADMNNMDTTIHAIGTKWVFRNKKDEKGVVIRNKAILVAQGHTQEERTDYDEVFAHVARIEAIRKIEKEVYVCQPPGFEDPDFPDRKKDEIFISQDKYVVEILKKFGFIEVKNASTPMETQKPLLKDEDGEEVDVYMYRLMIGSLMYLTSSRPDIMFVVCACARYQVKPKVSHLYAMKRMLRKPTRNVTELPQPSDLMEHVVDEAVHKELGDSLSDEDRLKLNELMELFTNLHTRVLDLEKTKTIQANKIDSLKRRVKKLKRRSKSRTHKLKRLYKVGLTARVESSRDEESLGEDASKHERRIDDFDADEDITLVSVHDDTDKEMFDADKGLGGEEVFLKQEVPDKKKIDEVTLDQALPELKTLKPKVKGVVIKEPIESTTTTTTFSLKQKSQDKGKAKMVEEPVKPIKKEQIRLDEEVALKLQTKFAEEERLARERERA